MLVPILLIAGLLPASGSNVAPSEEALLAQAEDCFFKGQQAWATPLRSRKWFAQAARTYEEIRLRGAHNPALYFNLGQSYFLAGNLPRAILSFRAGLDLDPGNGPLQESLEQVRGQVVYATGGAFGRPPVDHRPPWLPRTSTKFRLTFTVFLYVLACAAFTRWWMMGRGWLLWLAIPAVTMALALGIDLGLEERQRSWEEDHPLVVVAADRAFLHKGNGFPYPCYDAQARTWVPVSSKVPPEATPLPRGGEARLRFETEDWVQIELSGGEIGWVRRKAVSIAGLDY